MSLAQAVTENARIQALARDDVDFQAQRAEAARAIAEAKAARNLQTPPSENCSKRGLPVA